MTRWAARSTPTARPRSRPSATSDLAEASARRAGNALEHCSGAVETPAICKTLREHGAVTAQMTGSGAAVFGIFDDENAARSAVAALEKRLQAGLCLQAHPRRPPRDAPPRCLGPKNNAYELPLSCPYSG